MPQRSLANTFSVLGSLRVFGLIHQLVVALVVPSPALLGFFIDSLSIWIKLFIYPKALSSSFCLFSSDLLDFKCIDIGFWADYFFIKIPLPVAKYSLVKNMVFYTSERIGE
ncbi:hypothetical protein [Marinibactrum halimedae]|uniref:hypothetical protein n=1 Tax=Marinibactrum halimedae TaxID=1444977 RepID=UPI001E579E6A|nr:hypothetical protein [Marinibactrum halimedae]MCD9459399.1 hypothetical protein [Marinibactrum halimedae]